MMLFLVGALLVAGTMSDGSHSPGAGADLEGLSKDGPAPAALVTPALDQCKKFCKGGLKDIPKASDLKDIKTSLGSAANDSIKTVERTVFSNVDEAGHETGNKTVVEKTTETDVKPGGNVSKTSETQVVVDKEGKISGEKNVTESESVTETTPEDGTVTTTTEVKKVTDDEGNEVSEEVVIKKNVTEEKPKDGTAAPLPLPKAGADDQGKNKTKPAFSASGKSDGPQKVNRTETTTKVSRGNDTNEVLVTKEEQSVSPKESVKVTSKESKNVTDKADGKDVEKETVVQKEVERNVCNGDATEVHDAKHLNETVEDLKHQVTDVENKIKEVKAKAKEASVTPTECTVQEATGAREGVVVKTAVPSVKPEKVITKVVPSAKVVTEGRPAVITEKKVIEKVVPSAAEGKVPIVTTTEKVAEQAAASAAEEIVAIPEEQEQVPVVTEEKVVEEAAPSLTEEKAPLVTKRLVEKITPAAAEEKTVTQQKTVEKAAPPAKESVVLISKGEEE